jgi:hypothetical protein
MKASLLFAAIAAMFGTVQAEVKSQSQYARATRFGKSRIPGKPERAGDKVARMVEEGRLTVRKGW